MSQLGFKQLPIFIENCLYKSIAIISNKSPVLFAENIQDFRNVLNKDADQISFNQSPQELELLFWVFKGRVSIELTLAFPRSSFRSDLTVIEEVQILG